MWIAVVAYRRWGNNAPDLTEPDQLLFAFMLPLIYLASGLALRPLAVQIKEVLIQRRTCMYCRHHS
ncbi:MAG TPA: hypothetical protein DGT23_18720 [Micromonosporaceae bacterium]|nr:hypothetical protein [Micromonosporaceae bacterium]